MNEYYKEKYDRLVKEYEIVLAKLNLYEQFVGDERLLDFINENTKSILNGGNYETI